MSDELELEECWKAVRPRLKGGKSCKARLIGQVFTRLRVVRAAGTDKHKATLWLCVCECGKEKVVARGALKSGRVKSCGCLLAEYKLQAKPHLRRRPHAQRTATEHRSDGAAIIPPWDGSRAIS